MLISSHNDRSQKRQKYFDEGLMQNLRKKTFTRLGALLNPGIYSTLRSSLVSSLIVDRTISLVALITPSISPIF